MEAIKHEMVCVKFTKSDLTEMLMAAVGEKYPHLFDTLQWDWEDSYIAKDIHQTAFKDDDVAVELTFTKLDDSYVAPIDERERVVHIGINEVCR